MTSVFNNFQLLKSLFFSNTIQDVLLAWSSWYTSLIPCSSKTVSIRAFISIFFSVLGRVFNKIVIPLALVRYETIIANLALRASLAIYHLGLME